MIIEWLTNSLQFLWWALMFLVQIALYAMALAIVAFFVWLGLIIAREKYDGR